MLLRSLRAAARAILAAALLTAFSACAGDGPTGLDPTVATIDVAPGADTLVAIGRVRQWTAVPRDGDGDVIAGVSLRWRSSDTLIARVDSLTGLVTAVSNGQATITAASGVVTGAGTATVIQLVAAVVLTPGTSALSTIGSTQAFTAVANDSGGSPITGVRFLWTSSNPTIATVDTLGVARAIGAGVVTIGATGLGVPAYSELTVTQAATQLAFTVQPQDVAAGNAFGEAIEVEIRDGGGTLVSDSRATVTISLVDGGAPATLWGTHTVNAVNGIATFSGLWLDLKNSEYSLAASSAGLAPDTSLLFDVRSGPARTANVNAFGNPVLEVGVIASGAAEITFFDEFGNAADSTPSYSLLAVNGALEEVSIDLGPILTPVPGFVAVDGFALRQVGSGLRLAVSFDDGPGPNVVAFSQPLAVRATHLALAVASTHSCAMTAGGPLCWGSNAAQQLLLGGTPVDSVPRLLPLAGTYTQVTVRPNVTCVLRQDGGVECYGAGPDGLVAGTGPGGAVLVQITSGNDHDCGITADGRAYCWGVGTDGQLGQGLFASSASAVQVTGSGPGGLVFNAIDGGGLFTCGVTDDGAGYCWGNNGAGALGDSTGGSQASPSLVYGTGPTGFVLAKISAGSAMRACATTDLGDVLCWGDGIVGEGTGLPHLVPVLVAPTFGGTGWTDVSVGGQHTCIQSYDGGTSAMWCWGSNFQDQVGPNADISQLTPMGVQIGSHTILDVEAGEGQTCARTTNGSYCWGNNGAGRLGLGYTEPAQIRVPTRMMQ